MNKKNPVKIFIEKMNKNATKYGLKNTTYSNSTGLGNIHNKSTAYDISKLAFYALR